MDLELLKVIPPWEWPEDTATKLLEALRDNRLDPADRRLAAELAGDYTVVNDELFEALLTVLHDPAETEEVRATAAIALGPALESASFDGFEFPEEVPISETMFDRARAALRELFADESLPTLVRRRVLEAAVRAEEDWHRQAIRDAWSDPDPLWKRTAVFGMEYVSGFDGEILEALDSSDEEIVYHGILAAGAWELDAAWPALEGILASETDDKALLLAAIEATVTVRPEDAAPYLGELLDHDDGDVQDAAMEALQMAEMLDDLDDLDDEDDSLN